MIAINTIKMQFFYSASALKWQCIDVNNLWSSVGRHAVVILMVKFSR